MRMSDRLKNIEDTIKTEISYFENKLGFNEKSTIEDMNRDFFKASRFFAYMELKKLLSVLNSKGGSKCRQEAV